MRLFTQIKTMFSEIQTKMSCTRLHQTPFAMILLKFGFKRDVVKKKGLFRPIVIEKSDL
jgi:hypothetical protein